MRDCSSVRRAAVAAGVRARARSCSAVTSRADSRAPLAAQASQGGASPFYQFSIDGIDILLLQTGKDSRPTSGNDCSVYGVKVSHMRTGYCAGMIRNA